MKRYLLFQVTFLISYCVSTVLHADTVAVLGDSTSTGAAAHPSLHFDVDQLEKLFQGEQDLKPDKDFYELMQKSWEPIENPALAPKRLSLSKRDYENPLSWVFQNALHSFTRLNLDAEEYSWFYLLSRKRKISPHEILIPIQDGEKSEDALRQVDRVLDATHEQAVRHLFVFFTGTDLCAPDVNLASSGEQYAAHIEKALRYYIANAKVDQNTSHIWLVDPIGILQIVSSPDILKHQVKAYGRDVSCRDLQTGLAPQHLASKEPGGMGAAALLTQIFGQGPRAYCPSLFGLHDDTHSSDRLIQLGSTLQSYRKNLEKLTLRMQGIHPSYRVHHLKTSSNVILAGEDMAQDCFHLDLNGQLKIAGALHAEMEDILK